MGVTATESVGEASGALWAVVGSGEILSEDGGAQWRNISSDGVPDYFDDLTGLGRDDLWFAADAIFAGYVNLAVGEGTERSVALGRSSDEGKTWSVVSLPESELSSVTLSFVSPLDGFALGGASDSGFDTGGRPNALYKTTDGGRTWEEVSFASVEGPVDFTTPLDGWAAPEGVPGSWASIEHTSDGGVTWQAVRPAGAARALYLAAASFFGRSEGVVPAELVSANGRALSLVVYTTSDSGGTWSAHRVPGAVLSSLPAAQAARSGKAPAVDFVNASTWVVATGSQLIATADGGLHWSTAQVASWRGTPPESVAFVSAGTGVADVNYTLVRTTDGGRTWRAVPESAVLPGGARTVNQWPTTSPDIGRDGTWASAVSIVLPRGAQVTSLSCAAELACTAVDSKGGVATFERARWSARREVDTVGLKDVSCAPALCLAVDGNGRVLVKRAGSWSIPRAVLQGATAVSCAGRLCAVVGAAGARTYGSRGWGKLVRAKVGLTSVSCASATFCLAIGTGSGEVYDGAGWSPTPPSQPAGAAPLSLRAVSCASAQLCVVVESSGAVGYFLGNGWVLGPMGVGWPSAPPFAPVTVSCSSAGLCAAPNAAEVVSVLASSGWDAPVRLDVAHTALRASCGGSNCMAVASNGRTCDFALGAEAGVASATSRIPAGSKGTIDEDAR